MQDWQSGEVVHIAAAFLYAKMHFESLPIKRRKKL